MARKQPVFLAGACSWGGMRRLLTLWPKRRGRFQSVKKPDRALRHTESSRKKQGFGGKGTRNFLRLVGRALGV
jgi:hypothetical protein